MNAAVTMHRMVLVGVLLGSVGAMSTKAQETNVPSATLTVRAGRMDYLPDERCFICDEDVVVTISNVTLYASRVVAYQNREGAADEQDFARIVASGNVRVIMGARTVRGQKGEWDRATKAIRITGNPVARERGGREITAAVIIYDLAQDRISFEGRMQLRAVVTDDLKRDYRDFKGL